MLIESLSGIRGIFGDSLTEEVAGKYAYCYLSFLKKKYKNPIIVIGTDTRLSNEILKNAVTEVLNVEIIDAGIASTPAVEFGVRHFKANGGIIITASHNEPYWNGFKFLNKDGSILKEKDMEGIINEYQKIKDAPLKKTMKILDFQASNKLDIPIKIKNKKIINKHKELIEAYSDFVLDYIKKDIPEIKNSGIKVVIDPNGGTGIIAKEILERAGVKVVGVNMQYSIFNRKVEPTQESLLYLGGAIKKNEADFGAGFDCDADRVQIVLPDSKVVSGHYIFALICNEFLKKQRKKIIVANNASSGIIHEVVKKNNAKLIEVEVGEANVVEAMDKNKAVIGGESTSGGIILPPSKCRDGIITLLLVIRILAEKKVKIKRILEDYPVYHTFTENIKSEEGRQDEMRNSIEGYYLSKKYTVLKAKEGGSIKVIIDKKSFVWFRISKTESNILRIIADSPSRPKTEKLLKEAIKIFNKAK